tara:strand:- start:1021 stop:1659 length:639 start_codon:yes stop_codon:yes gene_type:complete
MYITNITQLPWETIQYIDELNAKIVKSSEINVNYIKDSQDESTKYRLNIINKKICTYVLCKAIKMWESCHGQNTSNLLISLPGFPLIMFKTEKIPSWYNYRYHEQHVHKYRLMFSDGTKTEVYEPGSRWIDYFQFKVRIGKSLMAMRHKQYEVVRIKHGKCNCLKPIWDKKTKKFRLCERKVLHVPIGGDTMPKQLFCKQHGKMLCGPTHSL